MNLLTMQDIEAMTEEQLRSAHATYVAHINRLDLESERKFSNANYPTIRRLAVVRDHLYDAIQRRERSEVQA